MGNICNTNICCDQEFEEENLYRLGYQNGCFYVVDTNNQILVKDNEQKGQQPLRVLRPLWHEESTDEEIPQPTIITNEELENDQIPDFVNEKIEIQETISNQGFETNCAPSSTQDTEPTPSEVD